MLAAAFAAADSGGVVRIGGGREVCKVIDKVVYIPEQPFVSPIPGVPPAAASTTVNFQLGWNARATSLYPIQGPGEYKFTVRASAVGTVTGLARTPQSSGFSDILFGFYVSRGDTYVYESGTEVANLGYHPGAELSVARRRGNIEYRVAGTLVRTVSNTSDPLVLTTAMYAGGDEIVDPDVEEWGEGDGAGIMLAAQSFGGNVPYAIAYGTMMALESVAYRNPSGSAEGTMLALQAYASDLTGYATAFGSMLPMEGESESLGLAPGFALADTTSLPMIGAAQGTSGQIGEGEGTAAPLLALGSDRPYGEGRGTMSRMAGNGGYARPLNSLRGRAKFTAYGAGSESELQALRARMAFTAGGLGGATAKTSAPRMTAGGQGTTTLWGQVRAAMPRAAVTALGTTAERGALTARAPRMTCRGLGGAALRARGPRMTARGTGASGAIGRLLAPMPSPRVTASGTRENFGVLVATMPAGRMAPAGSLRAVMPAAWVTAAGSTPVSHVPMSFVANLESSEGEVSGRMPPVQMTRYTNFPFTQIVRFDGRYYGAAADGIYLLEGDDDAGTPTAWSFETCMTDFGATTAKNLVSAYVGGLIGEDVTFTVASGETPDTAQLHAKPVSTSRKNHREVFGRGLRTRYYGIGIAGSGEMAIDSIEFEINNTTRRI